MANTHKSKILTPEASVIVWNFNHRLDSVRRSGFAIEQISDKLILTNSLTYISTSKSKSKPDGSFEFRLAPDCNWVAKITPGSWCAILMANNNPPPSNSGLGISLPKIGGALIKYDKAQSNTLKMLGRIHSVRADITVDDNGTRSTSYIVTGEDWAGVYNTYIYIDPIVRNNNLDKLTDISQILRLGLDKMLPKMGDTALPSTSMMVDAIMQIWGNTANDLQLDFNNAVSGAKLGASNPIKPDEIRQLGSGKQFTMPSEVAAFMGFGNSVIGGPGNMEMGKIIKGYHGRLTSYDQYDSHDESFGIYSPQNFFGTHSFWQLLNDVCNTAVNELVADIRWEQSGLTESPKLALYKRIRPFITRTDFLSLTDRPISKKNVDSVTSEFKNVRRHNIALNDIVTINAGTNWRDKINFIEINTMIQQSTLPYDASVKNSNQLYDTQAYLREGFRPMFETTYYTTVDKSGTTIEPLGATDWKYAMREWYFNTHLMLNGSMMVIGQDQYIGVGDNIMVDASIFGAAPTNAAMASPLSPSKTFFLAHVENIAHTFQVDPVTGARTFNTVIFFVRGIFTDANGALLGNARYEVAAGLTSEALDETSNRLLKSEISRSDVVRSPPEETFDPFKL